MAQEIPEQLFVGQVAQKALIEHDGKVLISLDTNVDNWDFPVAAFIQEKIQKRRLREK